MSTDGIYRYINPNNVIKSLADAPTIEDGVNDILKNVEDLGGEDNASIIVGHLFE